MGNRAGEPAFRAFVQRLVAEHAEVAVASSREVLLRIGGLLGIFPRLVPHETPRRATDPFERGAGEYFRGASSAELNKVYESLKLRLQAGRREKVEIASLLAVLGGVLVVASALLSLARPGRVV